MVSLLVWIVSLWSVAVVNYSSFNINFCKSVVNCSVTMQKFNIV